MNNILITGAYGFIGRHLARHLSLKKYNVSGLGHGAWGASEYRRWGLKYWFQGDVSLSNLCNLPKQSEPDLIFHLAGGSTVGAAIAEPRGDFKKTVLSTLDLLEWVRLHHRNAKIIVISSAAVYGTHYNIKINEDQACMPVSVYGYNKLITENLCSSYVKSYGIDLRIARLFSVYGNELKKQLLWDLCNKIYYKTDEIFLSGTGNEVRDWLHIDDAVSALELIAMEHGSREKESVFNVGTGIGTSVREIAQNVIDAWFESEEKSRKRTLKFSGLGRVGDPESLVANNSRLIACGFRNTIELTSGILNYVKWYKDGH